MPQTNETWHFDKRIPLAMIGAILIQTGTVFWWASSINERVSTLESWHRDSKGIAADIAVMRSQIIDLKTALNRIENRLGDH